MRYFVREDGAVSRIGSDTPSYLARAIELSHDKIDADGKVVTKARWHEITPLEYAGIMDGTMKWNGEKVVSFVPPVPTREEVDALAHMKYNDEVKRQLLEKGYSVDRVQAIICNFMMENDAKRDEHAREMAELEKARKECKDKAYLKVYGVSR